MQKIDRVGQFFPKIGRSGNRSSTWMSIAVTSLIRLSSSCFGPQGCRARGPLFTFVMSQLIPGDASMLLCRLLVCFVWGITPFAWFSLLLRALHVYLSRRHDIRLEELCMSFLNHRIPYAFYRRIWQLLQTLKPSRHPILSGAFYTYCGIEVVFSLYHWHLSRTIQRPGPRPLYGRRFLRSVFAQALEAGLGKADQPDHANSSAVSKAAFNGSTTEQTEPADVRQRLGRLRATSFVPEFVQRPLQPDDPRAIKFQKDQAKWFFDVDFDLITRRDVMHWLAWSLFGTNLEELEHEREQDEAHAANVAASATPSTANSPMPPYAATFEGPTPEELQREDVRGVRAVEHEWDPTTGDRLRFVEYCLELLEARQGKSFPQEGPAPKLGSARQSILKARQRIRMMRLTIDPVRTASRPFASYVVTNALSRYTIQRAVRGGFKMHTEGRLPYLLREPRSTDHSKSSAGIPLIVLHGLGIGLAQYASLVTFLLESPVFAHRPVMILLQPNISQDIFSPHFLKPFGHHETTSAFRRVIAQRGWNQLDVLSHSYGSLVHSWLLKSLGSRIRRSCFVDPVCFQLWVPFVCSNFVYKRVRTPIELLMRYFVSRELGTANTLCRYFDWSSNILWPKEIDNLKDNDKTRFYLAQQDAILSAPDTLEYLVDAGCPRENIYYGEKKAHGEMLMHGGDAFSDIVDWLAKEI